MMLKKINLFNKESVCIFTDASLYKKDGIVYICSGACVYVGDLLIDQTYEILPNHTIQQGELYAILLGVLEAVKYKDYFRYIRLFSDSLTSILALKERIFKWVCNKDSLGNLRGYDNNVISNQDYIMHIINTILMYNIRIELYHTKGHIKPYDNDDLLYAKEVFAKSNQIYQDIDLELIRAVTIGNNQVDRYTGFMLYQYYSQYLYLTRLQSPVEFGCNDFDIQRYRGLITKGYM